MGALAGISGVEALTARVGARVRKARSLGGMPRRVLSERSGVSPRYLAQLEAGRGNMSLALLQRVADALGLGVEALVGADDPWASDVARATDLFRAAGPEMRARVLDLLRPGARAGRICLIGLRGAGKSTLGRRAGVRLDLPFVELNRVIEDEAGMPVTEVMALYGPEGYRRLEAEALTRVIAAHERLILAVAGGIVADRETYARLLRHFHTVWVKASPQEHMARVRAQGDTRPMAGNPQALAELRTILTGREAEYGKAEAVLDTSGRSVEGSLDDLVTLIADAGFLA